MNLPAVDGQGVILASGDRQMAAPDFPVDATVALLDDEARTTSPDVKQRSTLLTVCPFILGNEFCERLAFYGYAASPAVWMSKLSKGCNS